MSSMASILLLTILAQVLLVPFFTLNYEKSEKNSSHVIKDHRRELSDNAKRNEKKDSVLDKNHHEEGHHGSHPDHTEEEEEGMRIFLSLEKEKLDKVTFQQEILEKEKRRNGILFFSMV